MRFSKMHFRKSKRALWIFTPSEMRLQRVKKTKFLKNELGGKLRTRHSPSRLAAAHFCSFTLWGGYIRFFQKRMFFVKKLMFGVSLGIGALTDRKHGCRPGCSIEAQIEAQLKPIFLKKTDVWGLAGTWGLRWETPLIIPSFGKP